jgi:hypothetical protein
MIFINYVARYIFSMTSFVDDPKSVPKKQILPKEEFLPMSFIYEQDSCYKSY